MEDDAADSSDFARVRRIQQGPQAPGVQLRRPDGRLCVHAGGWNGKRPPRRLFPLPGHPAGLEDWIFDVTKSVEMAFERDRFVVSSRGTRDSKGDAASGTVVAGFRSDERRRFTKADAREKK